MKRYLSIGLMSGTSMDGIDCGLIKTDGDHDITVLGKPYSLQYDPTFKTLLKAAAFAVKQKEGNLIEAKDYYLNAITDYLKESLDDKTNTKTEEKIAQEIAEEFQKIKYYLEENNIEFAKLTFDTVAQHSTYLHGKIVANLIKELGLQHSISKLVFQ
jgi:1,6-anhydro-N-acetylmuramate kinase